MLQEWEGEKQRKTSRGRAKNPAGLDFDLGTERVGRKGKVIPAAWNYDPFFLRCEYFDVHYLISSSEKMWNVLGSPFLDFEEACPRPQTELRMASVLISSRVMCTHRPKRLAVSFSHPDISSFPIRKSHLKPNWVASSCALGAAESQGLKPVVRVAPSPSPALSPPLGAAPGACVPETRTREEGKGGPVSRVANPPSPRCPRGGASARPAPGRGCLLPAAKYKCSRARRLAPLACTAGPRSASPRGRRAVAAAAAAAGTAAPPRPRTPQPYPEPTEQGAPAASSPRARNSPLVPRASANAARSADPCPPRLSPPPLPLTFSFAFTAFPSCRTFLHLSISLSPFPLFSFHLPLIPTLDLPFCPHHLLHPSLTLHCRGNPPWVCGLLCAPVPQCPHLTFSRRPSRLSARRPGPGRRKDVSRGKGPLLLAGTRAALVPLGLPRSSP